MGIGMPAAVAAALRQPGRQVIHFLGDGGALMTGSELATAMQYGANVKTFISNNGSYGTIRMHQEIAYKRRVHGTDLKNPDFAKWGESFGALGLSVASHRGGAGSGGEGAGARRAGGGGREDRRRAHRPVRNDRRPAGGEAIGANARWRRVRSCRTVRRWKSADAAVIHSRGAASRGRGTKGAACPFCWG